MSGKGGAAPPQHGGRGGGDQGGGRGKGGGDQGGGRGKADQGGGAGGGGGGRGKGGGDQGGGRGGGRGGGAGTLATVPGGGVGVDESKIFMSSFKSFLTSGFRVKNKTQTPVYIALADDPNRMTLQSVGVNLDATGSAGGNAAFQGTTRKSPLQKQVIGPAPGAANFDFPGGHNAYMFLARPSSNNKELHVLYQAKLVKCRTKMVILDELLAIHPVKIIPASAWERLN